MVFHRPFCRIARLAVPAVAALVLLTPAQILPAWAQGIQTAQQATLSDGAKSDSNSIAGAGIRDTADVTLNHASTERL